MIILSNLSCKSQSIIAIEKTGEYVHTKNGIPDNVTYIKDINGVRDKYIGTWKGTYNGKIYQLIFAKKTTVFDGLTEDGLIMRYVITDSNGNVLEDTSKLPDDSPYIVTSRYYERLFFALTYEGRQSDCGQAGELFVEALKNTNYKTLQLFLSPRQGFINSQNCPNGAAVQLFPKSQITLTKQ